MSAYDMHDNQPQQWEYDFQLQLWEEKIMRHEKERYNAELEYMHECFLNDQYDMEHRPA